MDDLEGPPHEVNPAVYEFSEEGPRSDAIGLLEARHKARAATNRALLEAIRKCDELEVWIADGCHDMAEWVAGHCDVSCWVAKRWIKSAHALVELPRLSRALESGELSLEKTVELARWATPKTERKLITWAKKVSLSAIRRRGEMAETEATEEVKEEEHQRSLKYWWVDNGRYLWLQGLLPAAQGTVVANALDRVADRLPEIVADDEDDTLNLITHDDAAEKRCADALYVLASRHIATDSDPERATVVVHVDAEVLGGGQGEAWVENGPQLRRETAQMLACDARMQVVMHAKDGPPLNLGRMTRTAPAYMKRLLRHRDRTCSFPGCEVTRFLAAHHVRWWGPPHFGETRLDGLTLVCPFHHALVHERGWTIALDDKGHATWFRPDGTAYLPRERTPVEVASSDESQVAKAEREPEYAPIRRPRADIPGAEPDTQAVEPETRAGPVAGRQPIAVGIF